MRIILNEKQIKTLITEAMGVSRICLIYTNIILNKITPIIENFIQTRKQSNTKIIISTSELSEAWKSDIDDYMDLPIYQIEIKLFLKKGDFEKIGDTFSTGGATGQIYDTTTKSSFITKPSEKLPKYVRDQISSSLNAKFDFEVVITDEFDKSQTDELMYDLRDTILHETNHILEFYRRNERGLGYANISLASVSTNDNYDIPEKVFRVWREFLTLVYYSEPQEINAMVQEMYSRRLELPFEEFKKHRYYTASKYMQTFDAEKMFNTLTNRIIETDSEQLVPMLIYLWKKFMTDYKNTSDVLEFKPNKKLDKSTNVLEIMKILQPRINNAGHYLQKKFNKLYSLEL